MVIFDHHEECYAVPRRKRIPRKAILRFFRKELDIYDEGEPFGSEFSMMVVRLMLFRALPQVHILRMQIRCIIRTRPRMNACVFPEGAESSSLLEVINLIGDTHPVYAPHTHTTSAEPHLKEANTLYSDVFFQRTSFLGKRSLLDVKYAVVRNNNPCTGTRLVLTISREEGD
jgi:hypothetical protein